jgi:hypothetical protein
MFDGLRDVVATVPKTMDTKDRSHVPFVVILLQALEKWRSSSSNGENDDGGSPTGGDANPTDVAHENNDCRSISKR